MRVRRLSAVGFVAIAASAALVARAQDLPDPYESALKDRPAEQKKSIARLAAGGDVRAAARMIDLELWEEMRDIPVGTPAIDAWQKLAGPFSGMTGEQVLGCIEANWAGRQSSWTRETIAARVVQARGRMTKSEVKNPALALELASWFRNWAPKDVARAKAFESFALPMFEDPPAGIDALVRGVRLLHALEARDSDWYAPKPELARTKEIAERAAAACEEAGDRAGVGAGLKWQAWCLLPDRNPPGDWTRAAALYGRGAAAGAEGGDLFGQALCLSSQAWCLDPSNNSQGDWGKCVELYARAAELYAARGMAAKRAYCLHRQGICLLPNRNPNGDWDRAAALFAEAASIRGANDDRAGEGSSVHEQAWAVRHGAEGSGDLVLAASLFGRAAELHAAAGKKESTGDALYWQGKCLMPRDKKPGGGARAAAIFERAAGLYADIGAAESRSYALNAWAECLRPDNDPSGDWTRAGALYEVAAALMEALHQPKRQGRAVRDQAICVVHGDKARMTPASRRLFEKARDLLRDAGDGGGVESVEIWLK
jgi:hypothetical protein